MSALQNFSIGLLLFSLPAFADDYPDMTGSWTGLVRVVESGTQSAGVATGGALIAETDLTFDVTYQDRETFIGEVRSSRQPKGQPVTRVWGSVRSTGKEGLFITSSGGRGQIWFTGPGAFEYCYTNRSEEMQMSAYCAKLKKKQ